MIFLITVYVLGEANANKPDLYKCQFPAMITDWRQKFHNASDGETDIEFPFGFVQVDLIIYFFLFIHYEGCSRIIRKKAATFILFKEDQ